MRQSNKSIREFFPFSRFSKSALAFFFLKPFIFLIMEGVDFFEKGIHLVAVLCKFSWFLIYVCVMLWMSPGLRCNYFWEWDSESKWRVNSVLQGRISPTALSSFCMPSTKQSVSRTLSLAFVYSKTIMGLLFKWNAYF